MGNHRPGYNKPIKEAILQGVWRDNLRITGGAIAMPLRSNRGPDNPRPPRAPSRTSLGVTLLLVVAGIFAYLNPLGRMPEQQPAADRAASPMTGSGSVARAEAQVAPRTAWPDQLLGGNRSATRAIDYRQLKQSQAGVAGLFGLDVKTIVIDAGHGGRDPGAIGDKGTYEKDIALDIAHRLRHRLAPHTQYRILMTHTADKTLALKDRVEFANSHDADLFISIHLNHLPVESVTLVETYYFGPHGDDQALSLAQRENRGSGYRIADFKDVISDLEDTLKQQESKKLAQFIQTSLYSNIKTANQDLQNWGIKTAPFVVLLGVNAPAVLVEAAALSNHREEQRLATRRYRSRIASYLEDGVIRYLNHQPSPQTLTIGDPKDGQTGGTEEG